MKTIPERLKELNENGVSYAHIADVAGVNPTTVSKWANNSDRKTTFHTETAVNNAITKIKVSISKV